MTAAHDLRVEQEQEQKDRYAFITGAPRAPACPGGRSLVPKEMLDGGWLFPGMVDPAFGTRQLNRAIHAAADEAGIDKRISACLPAPCLCHPSAGAEVDIRLIQVPGAKKLETTALYAQVTTDILREGSSVLWNA